LPDLSFHAPFFGQNKGMQYHRAAFHTPGRIPYTGLFGAVSGITIDFDRGVIFLYDYRMFNPDK
jgi:hypothetical protein